MYGNPILFRNETLFRRLMQEQGVRLSYFLIVNVEGKSLSRSQSPGRRLVTRTRVDSSSSDVMENDFSHFSIFISSRTVVPTKLPTKRTKKMS